MSNRELDCRRKACPQPVILTKKALETLSGSEVLTVIVDNSAARENVSKFASSQGCGVCVEEKNSEYYITVTKGEGVPAPAASAAIACPNTDAGSVTTYLITQDTLGHGSPELGAVLMKSFCYTLLEKEPLPAYLLFLNSGVRLTVEGSPVLDHLRALADKGVEILSCGTCLDFYHLKEKLAVGGVTNMYTILEKLSAGRAVTL